MAALLAACRGRESARALLPSLRALLRSEADAELLRVPAVASHALRVVGVAGTTAALNEAWPAVERAQGDAGVGPEVEAAYVIALNRCGLVKDAEIRLQVFAEGIEARAGAAEDPPGAAEARAGSFLVACTSLVGAALTGRKDVARAHRVLGYLERARVAPNGRIFAHLIRHHARFGGLPALLRKMRALDLPVDQRIFHALLAAASDGGDAEGAAKLVRLMYAGGCAVGAPAYNLLLRAHARSGQAEAAWDAYAEMAAHGLRPTIHTFASLFAAISEEAARKRQGPGGAEAGPEDGEEGGEGGYNDDEDDDGVEEAEEDAAEEDLRFYDEVDMFGGPSDDFGWDASPEGAEEPDRAPVGDHAGLEKLERVEAAMAAHGVPHSPQSFTRLLQALGRLGLVYHMIARVERAAEARDPNLDAFALTAAITGCFRNRQVAQGFRLFDLMQAAGLKPNKYTFNALLSGCVEAQDPGQGRAVLEAMGAAGMVPNAVTLNVLVKLFTAAGEVEEALRHINAHARKGLQPSTWAVDLWIRAAVQQHREDLLEDLYDGLASGRRAALDAASAARSSSFVTEV